MSAASDDPRRPAGAAERGMHDQTRISDLCLAIDLAVELAARASHSGERTIMGIVGPPGFGKSTVAQKIIQENEFIDIALSYAFKELMELCNDNKLFW